MSNKKKRKKLSTINRNAITKQSQIKDLEQKALNYINQQNYSDSSFWYPSMRIFRQEQQGNWQALMQRVKEELLKFISLIS